VVYREVYAEGSRIAKAGTDEQEVHEATRLDEQAHHCDVRNTGKSVHNRNSRCTSDWPKETAFTWGGLGLGSVFLYTKKSAEVIVVGSNEPSQERWRSHKPVKD